MLRSLVNAAARQQQCCCGVTYLQTLHRRFASTGSQKFSAKPKVTVKNEEVEDVCHKKEEDGPLQESEKDGSFQGKQMDDPIKGVEDLHKHAQHASMEQATFSKPKTGKPKQNVLSAYIALGIENSKNKPRNWKKKLLNVMKSSDEDVSEISVFFPQTSEMIHINARTRDYKLLKQTLEEERRECNPAYQVESLTDTLWKEITLDVFKLPDYYRRLSKARLTGLVVLTTMTGYAMAPVPFDVAVFTAASFGTALTSCSANAVNQFLEIPFDSQMNRTKNRVLVKGVISPLHAVTFAGVCASAGLLVLGYYTNPLTAYLGAFNLVLYTLVYTPMKRRSILNTWVGAIVGAIPPVMGWTAATGSLDPGALLLGVIMYSWQFPHFNSLSWNLRQDYSRAGYRMMSVTKPAMCKRVALRHTVGLVGLCCLPPVFDMTTWNFLYLSVLLNTYFSFLAWQFYQAGNSNSARQLFRFSLIHIPILVLAMLFTKKEITTDNNVLNAVPSKDFVIPQSKKLILNTTELKGKDWIEKLALKEDKS